MTERRRLTAGEFALCTSVFAEAIDYRAVELRRRRWWPFQARNIVMAPAGHIHFHPQSPFWSDDFTAEPLQRQGLLIHEMVHVWQAQTRGRLYLVLMRHPLCRYRYRLVEGRPFEAYGIEQQAEIVRHCFLLSRGLRLEGLPPLAVYRALLPFARSTR